MPSEQTNEKNPLQKWLEFLQQESWQLELLISGFSIFLIAASFHPLGDWLDYLKVNASTIGLGSLGFFTFFVLGSLLFLLTNLVVHVILRGLWIGTIGLRYVSQEIDFDALNYSPNFTAYLRKKIGSYDLYIERLEKFCSSIFAFSFLMVFFLLSFMSFFMIFALVNQFLGLIAGGMDKLAISYAENSWHLFLAYFRIVFTVLYLFLGLIYFIDFVSLGVFKKKKWSSKLFYPIYLFFSFITFSFIYRPIYYNFIDNKYGRRFVLFAVPYMIIISSVGAGYIDPSNYFPGKHQNAYWQENEVYDDKREDKIITKASIPSKILEGRFIDLFLAYRYNDEVIKQLCPDLNPIAYSGFKTELFKYGPTAPTKDSLMQCLGSLYEVRLNDSLMQDLSYSMYQHPNKGEYGLNTILDTEYLEAGRHEIRIQKYYIKFRKDSLYLSNYVTIPFWKE